MLTIEEKALIIIDLLNRETPHGLGRDDWIKKHPGSQNVIIATSGKGKKNRTALEREAKMKYVSQSGKIGKSSRTSQDLGFETRGSGMYGGEDLKVEFGNNQEYNLAPLQNLPYTAHTEQSTGSSVMAEDPDLVNTALPKNEFLREEGKRLMKKGRSGFISDADPTLPYVQKEGYVSPSDSSIVLDQKQLTKLNSKHKKIVTPGKEFADKPRTNTSKPKGKRAPTAGSAFLNDWHAFCNKLKKEPFMGGPCRQNCSLVYELMKDIEKSDNTGGFDKSLIVGKLNELSGGSALSPLDVSNYLKKFRIQLHGDDNSIPLLSRKFKN